MPVTMYSSTISTSVALPSVSINPIEPVMIGTFGYNGCYQDLVDGMTRSLPYNMSVDASMTLEMCAEKCVGFDYFGTEFGDECYCGFTLPENLIAPETDCLVPCLGNPTELCGGGARLSTYHNSINIPVPEHIKHAPGYFEWLSCYTDSAARTLDGPSYASDGVTVELCTTFCKGFAFAGVEFGRECFCGNEITVGALPAPATQCSYLCAGNTSEYCGAADRLDLYQFNPALAPSSTGDAFSSIAKPTTLSTVAILELSLVSYWASVVESTKVSTSSSIPVTSSSSILSSGSKSSSISQSSSVAQLSLSPQSSSTTHLFSTSQSTSVSNLISTSAALTILASPATSSISASSSASKSSLMSIILPSPSVPLLLSTSSTNPIIPSSSTPSPFNGPSSNLATTTSPVPIFSPTPIPLPTTFKSLGCISEPPHGHLLTHLVTNNSVTPELCERYISSLALKPTPTVFSFYGVEYHNECYGGNELLFPPHLRPKLNRVTSLTGEKACTDVCAGSIGAKETGTKKCGGRGMFNLYGMGEKAAGFKAEVTKSA